MTCPSRTPYTSPNGPGWTVTPRHATPRTLPSVACHAGARNSATLRCARSTAQQTRPRLPGRWQTWGLGQAATITQGGCDTVAVADGRYPDSGDSGSRRSIGAVRTLSSPVTSRTRPTKGWV